MHPARELVLDCVDDGVEEAKVAIMQTETASEFPDPLDRIEFGTVGRKKIESESGGLLFSSGQVQPRMVVFGIITDDDHAAAVGSTGLAQEFQKLP